MAIKSSTFTAPTHVMALGHPFVSPAYTNVGGVPIGIDVYTRELVFFDPWLLKNAGVINTTFGILLGIIGQGKSATLKIIALRLMMLAAGYGMMRTGINDYKPEGKGSEYQAFSEVCQSEVFRLNNMSINPFEPRLFEVVGNSHEVYELGIIEMAETLCEFGKGAPLEGHEDTALRAAVAAMLEGDRQFWTPHILYKLLRSLTRLQALTYLRVLDDKIEKQAEKKLALAPNSAAAKETLGKIVHARDNLNVDVVLQAADRVATYLGNILNGSYGSMFGNTHSLYDMLAQRAVTKDWRGMRPEAETLMRTIDTRLKISIVENNRFDLLTHLDLDDEKHKSMDNLIYARSNAYFGEIARGTPYANLSATHRLASIRKGGVGSEQYDLGNTIINNLGWVFIGNQGNDKTVLSELQERYDLTDSDTQLLATLPPHTFGVKLGQREKFRIIEVFATPMELEVLGTNAATDMMVNRPDIMDDDQLRLFAENNQIAFLGGEEAYHL